MHTTKAGGYTLDDFSPYTKGENILPNWEELHTEEVTDNIASIGHSLTPQWGYVRLPDGSRPWAYYFLREHSGEGYVLIYGGHHGRNPRAGHFSICRHEKVDGPGANHSRGWHPGSCRLCGLNMSYDSGD